MPDLREFAQEEKRFGEEAIGMKNKKYRLVTVGAATTDQVLYTHPAGHDNGEQNKMGKEKRHWG